MFNLQMVMNLLNSGKNPQQFAQQLIQQNPQAMQFMKQIENMSNGMSKKDFAMQLARQNGIDINQFKELAERMGAK